MSESGQVQIFINSLCWKCLQKKTYQVIWMMQTLKDEKGPVYTREGANKNRELLLNIFLAGDHFATRNAVFQFWWGLCDNFSDPRVQHAMLEFIKIKLKVGLEQCQKRKHAGAISTIDVNQLRPETK